MGLSINGPGASDFGIRQIQRTAARLDATNERLSSLLRINRAGDDAAGLAISESVRTQVRQLNAESAGIQAGVTFAQTAEGGLASQSEAVGRLRELALQASNGTLSAEQRQALNTEAQELIAEIGATVENTEFNGVRPLDGSTSTITLDAAGSLEVQLQESSVAALGISGVDFSTQAGAAAALNQLDAAANAINENRAALGAQQNRFELAIAERELTSQNLQEADSRLRDLDVARAFVDRTRDEVLLKGSTAVLAQANLNRQLAARRMGA
jgi:flagellin